MADYIERQVAVRRFEQLKEKVDTLRDKLYLDGVLAVIDTIPAANAREDVKARWEYIAPGTCLGAGRVVCSNCRDETKIKFKYCPNCGAQMRGNIE